MNKKLLIGLTLALGTGATALTVLPASAHSQAHITCETSSACVVTYYNGYYMTRRTNGTTWVRLTRIPGGDNSHVAPVDCPSGGSTGPGTCTIAYSSAQAAYYGREFLGTSYRLTL